LKPAVQKVKKTYVWFILQKLGRTIFFLPTWKPIDHP
jgi:hypothetical protein